MAATSPLPADTKIKYCCHYVVIESCSQSGEAECDENKLSGKKYVSQVFMLFHLLTRTTANVL